MCILHTMSNISTDIFLEDTYGRFMESVELAKWTEARVYIKNLREFGLDKEADECERIFSNYRRADFANHE